MSKSITPKRFVLAVAMVLLAWAGWYLGRPEKVHPPASAPASAQPVVEEAAPLLPAAGGDTVQKPSAKPVPLPDSQDLPVWERKIDEALRSNADTAVIAQMLLQQVPTMPKEGQAASARHIANLIPDKDYLSLLPYIQNTRLDAEFLETMVAESLNRPDSVKLPVLLLAARTPQHPMAEVAKSTLAFLLDADHGSDWGKWDAAVKETLDKQARETQQ